MIGRASDVLPVALSVRLYRLFLIVYPKSFRREYGPHMLQVFRDYSLRVYDRSGLSGMLSLWALTLLDLLRSMVEQHLQKETFMSKDTLIRLSGWALIAGGIASGIGFAVVLFDWTGSSSGLRLSGVWEGLMVVAFFYGPIGVALGSLGLRARFGEAVGGLARNALLLGAIGGTALMLIGDYMQSARVGQYDNGFGIWTYGLALTFVMLEVYGILALRRKPQSRWNGLAALAGAPITLLVAITALVGASNGTPPLGVVLFVSAMMALMSVALVMLGFLVQSDLPEPMAAEPAGA